MFGDRIAFTCSARYHSGFTERRCWESHRLRKRKLSSLGSSKLIPRTYRSDEIRLKIFVIVK